MTEEELEESFLDWLNSNASPYTFVCEWFYGDCEVEDPSTRKELLYKWLLSAYKMGYNEGMKLYGGTE